MPVEVARTDDEIITGMDAAYVRACAAQRELFSFIADAERRDMRWVEGAKDVAHMLARRYGISYWRASRWVDCALALESLPVIAGAFASGVLGLDQVLELTRFATPNDEHELLEWARDRSSTRIREEADLRARRARDDAESVDRMRRLDWWFHDDGRWFSMTADLPAAEGAVVVRAIERMARRIPVMPGEEGPQHAPARHADGLVALASARISEDPHPDRATVIVHAPVEVLAEAVATKTAGESIGLVARRGVPVAASDSSDGDAGDLGTRGCRIEPGGVIPAETAMRLLCHSRVQRSVENGSGDVVRLSTVSRDPPEWMMRHLRYRDGGCTYPGCGERRWTRAHHIRWWSTGGPTELSNLVLVCHSHHKLVHEYRWSLTRRPDGTVRWYRPDGRRHRAGPAPPAEHLERRLVMA